MINIFYGYGIIWIIVMFFYFLGWSDLCKPIEMPLIFFLCFTSVTSILVGFLYRKKLQFIKLQDNPHKKMTITILLIIIYVAEIVYEKKLPLISVLKGKSYTSISFNGIPNVHLLISSFSIFYCIYLSYIFACFHKKKVLIEITLIVFFFFLLVQRQNIIICIAMLINILYCSISDKEKKKNTQLKRKIVFICYILLILYFFGIFGNMRYGATWDWNDSSMISSLGKINNKYPSFLPKEYFWTYIYILSPLLNLNHNITIRNVMYNGKGLFLEFIPEFIRHNFFQYTPVPMSLQVSSLTVCTAYARSYIYFGYIGMYLMYLVQLFVCVFVISFVNRYKKKYIILVACALSYFFLFSFFQNTFVYGPTAYMVIFSILLTFFLH